MCIRAVTFSAILLAGTCAGALASTAQPDTGADVLRVCADPDNLPLSNERGEGYENRIAAKLAQDLGRSVEYTFFPQRMGFVRNTLNERVCDVVMGVPSSMELMLTGRPYYRSTYVFVARADRGYHLGSLDDPRLRDLALVSQRHQPPEPALCRPAPCCSRPSRRCPRRTCRS